MRIIEELPERKLAFLEDADVPPGNRYVLEPEAAGTLADDKIVSPLLARGFTVVIHAQTEEA